jgi:hypothetical protein
MPGGLDTTDRKLLIGAGAFFVLLVVVSVLVSPPQTEGGSGVPSSYSPSWDGAEGAFLLLQSLGYRASRWEHPPTELPSDPSHEVLILADPSMAPSEEERYAISMFLQQGGHIIATGASANEFLPEAPKFQAGEPFESPQDFSALVPSPLTRGAPQITMTPPASWEPTSLHQIVLYGDEDTAAVVTYRFGKGDVVWWASATPLTNSAIRDSGNLNFFLNCVGPPEQVEVLWDEYFHGVRGSLIEFLARTPVLWGAAQFGLILLAVLATYSRRLGPIRAPVTQSRLWPLEFVDTLGDLYASAHVSAAAVEIASRRFRFILTRKLGLPIDSASAELAKSASANLGWEKSALLGVLKRCEIANIDGKIDGDDAVELVQQLHDYSARLEVKHTDQKEGQTE